jgi:hypothetical protein
VTGRDLADSHLVNTVLDIQGDDPAFGWRFDEHLDRNIVPANRVQQLCRTTASGRGFQEAWPKSEAGSSGPVQDDLLEGRKSWS